MCTGINPAETMPNGERRYLIDKSTGQPVFDKMNCRTVVAPSNRKTWADENDRRWSGSAVVYGKGTMD